MALIKDVSDATGATFSYWRITDVRIFPSGMRALVTLSGYVSAETRKAGLAPGGQTFGFDLAITDAKLPGPVSADTGISMYLAMATVFYEMIKAAVNVAPADAPASTDPANGDPPPDGTGVSTFTPHPLAGALDG